MPDFISRWKDKIGERLVGNRVFSRIVGFWANNFLWVYLEKTEDGYRKEFQGTEIEMKEQYHFADMVTHQPLKGYFNKIDIEEGEKIIDAGAFPGGFTIVAAKRGAEVIALEPDPKNAGKLRENLELNEVEDRVKVIEKGLWNERDTKSFERDTGIGMASRINEDAEVTVELDKIDSIVTENDFRPDLVKMDIEGAETAALEGAEKILNDIRPVFEIATYHLNDQGKRTFHEVEEKLKEHSYTVETGYKKHLTTYAFPE